MTTDLNRNLGFRNNIDHSVLKSDEGIYQRLVTVGVFQSVFQLKPFFFFLLLLYLFISIFVSFLPFEHCVQGRKLHF